MKRVLFTILSLLVMAVGFALSQESPIKVITLDKKDIIDQEGALDENEILYKSLNGFEKDDEGHVYYLADNLEIIYKAEKESKKLKKVISSKGQGPGEITKGVGMAVKGDKILINDLGFGGIKIFNLEGASLKEFRIGAGTISNKGLVVNLFASNSIDLYGNEIFLMDVDDRSNTIISVYNLDGKKLRRIIPVNADSEKDIELWVLNTNVKFRIDRGGDIVLLYPKKGFLKKFDRNGEIIWERDLNNDLSGEDKNKDKLEIIDNKRRFQVKTRLTFVGFCLTDNDDIFVSTYKGGIFYNKSGNPLFILKQPSGTGFGSFLIWEKNTLFTPDKIFKLNI